MIIRNIKKVIIFFLIGFLFCSAFGETYHVEIDTTNYFKNVVDLEKILSIKWALIPSPVIGNKSYEYFSFGKDKGWLLIHSRNSELWKRSEGMWERESLNPNVKNYGRFFAVSMNNLWITIDTSIPYKSNLINYNGKKWKEYKTPNTAGILNLWFNARSSGWAACDWGQILYFNGKSWEQKYCPTTDHIKHIMMRDDNYGVAITDNSEELLKYDGRTWSILRNKKADLLKNIVTFLKFDRNNEIKNKRKEYLDVNPELLKLVNVKTDVDTLILSGNNSFLFAHKFKPCFSYSGALLRDIKSADDNEIVCIMQISDPLFEKNKVYINYGLFTKKRLKRRIVVIQPYVSSSALKKLEFENKEFCGAFQHGICISDLTGDGFENMYAVVIRGVNRLYDFSVHRKSKMVCDIAEKLGAGGPTKNDKTSYENYDEGVSSADIDNDGDQDIFVTSLYEHNFLFKQRCSGKFKESSKLLGISLKTVKSTSGIWGDINNDGFVDLFVSNQNSSSILYLNNGAGFFTDITESAGINTEKAVWGSVFGDIDGDGDPDLFVPRRGFRNMLFINEHVSGSTKINFSEQAFLRGVAGEDTIAHSTSGVFADVDNDGDLDLYVTNLTCSNWLYINDGTGHFTDQTKKRGLEDCSLSQTSVLFDADNDGDLDIYAGNRGESTYFSNDGKGNFTNCTKKANAESSGWVSGLATGDLDEDGSLELYISDDLKSGRKLENSVDTTSNFIRIELKGTLSNRDAIGAKIFLYEAGFINDREHLLGMREISGGSGFNSMNSRIAHFGLPDFKSADAYILFPSGIEKKVYSVKHGQKYIIYEQNGLAKCFSYFKEFMSRTVKSPEHQKEALFIFLILFLLVNINYIISRQVWWEWKMAVFTFVIPLFTFIIFYLMFYNISHGLSHFLGAGFVGLFCFTGLMYSIKVLRKKENSIENLEKLFLASNAFFHGEWGARKLNRIQLYCTNLEPGKLPNIEMRQNLAESIKDFYNLIVPEIESILSYADSVEVAQEIQHRIHAILLKLSQLLNQLNVDMEINGPDKTLLKTILQQNQLLQSGLQALRKSIRSYFACNVSDIIKSIVNRSDQVVFKSDAPQGALARIRPAEFSQVIENMIDNSLRAMSSGIEEPVKINLSANADFMFISIKDKGKGIDEDIQKRLLNEQVSTKKQKGGFGLFHSRQVIEKYGGKIRLVKSMPFEITEFEINLKRIDNV